MNKRCPPTPTRQPFPTCFLPVVCGAALEEPIYSEPDRHLVICPSPRHHAFPSLTDDPQKSINSQDLTDSRIGVFSESFVSESRIFRERRL